MCFIDSCHLEARAESQCSVVDAPELWDRQGKVAGRLGSVQEPDIWSPSLVLHLATGSCALGHGCWLPGAKSVGKPKVSRSGQALSDWKIQSGSRPPTLTKKSFWLRSDATAVRPLPLSPSISRGVNVEGTPKELVVNKCDGGWGGCCGSWSLKDVILSLSSVGGVKQSTCGRGLELSDCEFAVAFEYSHGGTVMVTLARLSQKPCESWACYACTKSVINYLCSCIPLEDSRIRCVAFTPGAVDTDMQPQMREEGKASPVMQKFLNALEAEGSC
ncbi:hypothetical protein EDB80DRAFT_680087 [Ilyonectria destructans]|nr:hypothetical protein EDB80DRAFT_680087 [Ilyonectria destructans]